VSSLSDEEHLAEMLDAVSSSGHAAAALETRPRLSASDLQQLGQLPAGTLGRAFADHVLGEGLDVDVFPTMPSDTPDELLLAHLYEVHDIWRVITGFETDEAGALGLQASGAWQLPSKVGVRGGSPGLLNTMLRHWGERDRIRTAIARGWPLGQ
jgi:ubiquinone biosynthesis protein COQ4